METITPSRMPMSPPVRLSTIDSIRNCLRTAEERAPIAMRMPISRVRSVTETSMIFMIPMPPTSKRNARDAAKQHRHDAVGLVGRLGHVRHVAHGEVVRLIRREFVALAQEFRDLRLRRVGRILRDGRDIGDLHARVAQEFSSARRCKEQRPCRPDRVPAGPAPFAPSRRRP